MTMVNFEYKARDQSGKLIRGIIGADSKNAVAVKLKLQGYIPVDIVPAEEKLKIFQFLNRSDRVGFTELNLFTRQLFTLQKAGLPLLSSLKALREQTSHQMLQNVIDQMSREIEAGSTFSAALERHPQIFNALYFNMIKTGEVSGRLVEILERLAIMGEHEEMIRLRIKAAMRYPLIVVGAIVIGFLILITIVVPRFENLYRQFTVALPIPTQILLGIHYTITHFWWLLIIVIYCSMLLFHRWITTPEGRWWWDNVKLKIPVFGPLFLKLSMSRFGRIAGTLLQSGVPILQILDLIVEGVGNAVIAKTIHNIKISVNKGNGMVEPMKMSGLFPPLVIQMVSVGESSGKLDELLLHVSDYYDSQIDYTIKNLVSLIEPILIFILGITVLFMALGIFMPMWNLMNLFKK